MPRPPRFGDAPRRGAPPASAEEVARLMRRTGYASAALVTWALAGAIAAIARGRADGVTLAATAAPFAALALVALLLDLRAPTRAMSAAAAGAATIALSLAVAGHVLFWQGVNLKLFFVSVTPTARWTTFAGVLLLVPLYAGARLASLRLAWSASGSRARGFRVLVEAIARGSDAMTRPDWRRAWRGALARWGEGLALPGLLVLDLARRLRRPEDRLHAETTLAALGEVLAQHGAVVDPHERALVARFQDGPPLRLTQGRSLLPPGPTLEVRGPHAAARRLRRVLEGAASHALVFCWSAPARRWERRLNALHLDALAADTLAERSLVMEELDRVRKAIAERALAGEEFSVLSIKEREARTLLAHRMLSEPPGNRGDARIASQHAALVPDVARVLEAGGLASARRVAFVPHWILPVQTPWGEQECVVSAATGKLDEDESRALLAAMRRSGPRLLLDVGPQALFLPAPPPTGALLREMRAAGLAVPEEIATGEISADIVYVPYLATANGYASGITGRIAPDLGNAVPVAPA